MYGFIILILKILQDVLQVYTTVLVVYALLSWFPGAYQTSLGRFLAKICEPYLKLFDRFRFQIGPMDFTILVALLVLQFAGNVFFKAADGIINALFY